jgi:hypothetical protein
MFLQAFEFERFIASVQAILAARVRMAGGRRDVVGIRVTIGKKA